MTCPKLPRCQDNDSCEVFGIAGRACIIHSSQKFGVRWMVSAKFFKLNRCSRSLASANHLNIFDMVITFDIGPQFAQTVPVKVESVHIATCVAADSSERQIDGLSNHW